MSTVGGGVNIVRDGLVMYLDASNTKSLADVPSQNLVTWSQDLTNASWIQGSVTPTISGVAPDGTSTATLLTQTGTYGYIIKYNISSILTGTTYTVSCYMKAGTSTLSRLGFYNATTSTFNGLLGFSWIAGVPSTYSSAGNPGCSNITYTSVGNGWYRISFSTTTTSTTNTFYIYPEQTGLSAGTISVWGAQLELGSVATTYIPTTTVPVSRIPTWTDISKGGNNGTLTSGLTYNYSNGGSLVFNGTSNYVNCGNPANLQTFSQITLNTWVKFSGLDYVNNTGSLVTFIDKGQTDITPGTPSSGFWFAYDNRNNKSNFAYTCFGNTTGGYSGGGNNFTTKSYIFTNGVWYNITTTVNSSSQGALFINGVQQGTSVTFSNLNLSNTTNNLQVGMYLVNNFFFNGNNSQTQIYNRALSAAEVLQNYNATKSKFGL